MSPLLPGALPGLTALRLDWNQTDTAELVGLLGGWGAGLTQLAWANCDAMQVWRGGGGGGGEEESVADGGGG